MRIQKGTLIEKLPIYVYDRVRMCMLFFTGFHKYTHAGLCICRDMHTHVHIHACKSTYPYVMYACMHVCMYVCMHAWMYVCMYVWIETYATEYTLYLLVCHNIAVFPAAYYVS